MSYWVIIIHYSHQCTLLYIIANWFLSKELNIGKKNKNAKYTAVTLTEWLTDWMNEWNN